MLNKMCAFQTISMENTQEIMEVFGEKVQNRNGKHEERRFVLSKKLENQITYKQQYQN